MGKIVSRKGISLVALVITIIVLVVLTGAVVITGINVPQQGQLAVFKSNVSNVQDAVTLKMLNNMADKTFSNNENVKWIGVASGYTEESIANLSTFGTKINGVDVVALDSSLKEGMQIKDEEFAKYYVDAEGIVYHTGFTYDGVTYYNGSSSSISVESIEISSVPTKLEYNVGDTVEMTGLEVIATYSDGSTANVTSSVTYTPTLANITATEGTKAITVTYGGKTAIQKITMEVNVATLGSQIDVENYGQAVNYSVTVTDEDTGESTICRDWEIYYSTSEYVFLIKSSSIGGKNWNGAIPDESLVDIANGSSVYDIMRLGSENAYTLNISNNNSKCVADLVVNYGQFANISAYTDEEGISYVIGAIGGPTIELIQARANIINTGAITLTKGDYGYYINETGDINVNTGLPVTSYIWLASPSSESSGRTYVADASKLYSSRSIYSNGICPVVCLKSSIPAIWNGTTWEIKN